MSPHVIQINRAPVLTLWATLVAERMGFDRAEALTLGKAVAGLNAQSKGRRLGIFEPSKPDSVKPRQLERDKPVRIDLCGRSVPARKTDDGVRAMAKDKPVDPAGVERYLRAKFGDNLDAVTASMTKLVKAMKPQDLAEKAYALYEEFRPEIPSGVRGWGATGKLDLELIESLAGHKR